MPLSGTESYCENCQFNGSRRLEMDKFLERLSIGLPKTESSRPVTLL